MAPKNSLIDTGFCSEEVSVQGILGEKANALSWAASVNIPNNTLIDGLLLNNPKKWKRKNK